MSRQTQAMTPAVRLAGVDGCRGGWVAVEVDLLAGRCRRAGARFCPRIDGLIASCRDLDLRIMALDMPIGLLDEQRPSGRVCDRLARRLLGRPRASSVFSPPSRTQLLDGLRRARPPGGLSLQTFHLLRKIDEVDRALCPPDQSQVVEAHPELAFLALAGYPMRLNKKTRAGRRERVRALAKLPSSWRLALAPIVDGTASMFARADVAPDDLLDAAVLSWTAWRVYRGDARRLPPDPLRDTRGFRMEIVY